MRRNRVGTTLDLNNHPRNKFVAGFIGSPKMNLLTAKVENLDSKGAKLAAASSTVALLSPLSDSEKGRRRDLTEVVHATQFFLRMIG